MNDSSNRNGLALAHAAACRMVAASHVEDISDQIGERLRMAREKAGLGVDDIVYRTHMPRSVVLALESADFSVFSSPVYAKSFLYQYSEFLNVDACLWLDALEPAGFVAREDGGTLCVADSLKHDAHAPAHEPARRWSSTIVMMAASCGLLFLAMKGYEFLDARFGDEFKSSAGNKRGRGIQPDPLVPEISSSSAPEPKPSPGKPDDELAPQPPPRAIIVR